MYIEPHTNIRLLKNCPVDPDYSNTIYWDRESDQIAYFSGLTKYNLNNYSYQRVNIGVARIGINAESLYDCNYMMFQNTHFGDKWFYAFITKIEYVNNGMSNVYFEIDVMQTWWFEHFPNQCFVEREHSETDNIGDNLIPENVDLGDYVSEGVEVPSDENGVPYLNIFGVVFACPFDKDMHESRAYYKGGTFGALNYNYFDISSASELDEIDDFLLQANLTFKGDKIVSVFRYPKKFLPDNTSYPKSYEFKVNKLQSNMFPENVYKIKNNKLYTYPYNFLYCTNNQGNVAEFKYEYFSSLDGKAHFDITGSMSCDPRIIIEPRDYKGVVANYDEKLVLGGFPQCSYNSDAFLAWLSQTATSLPVSAMASAYSLNQAYDVNRYPALSSGGKRTRQIGQMRMENTIADTKMGILADIGSTIASGIPSAISPMQSHGQDAGQSGLSIGQMNFTFMKKHIRLEFAKIIDDYFSMFGYATKRVKYPDRHSRPHWNFVKTIGCTISGSVPADDEAQICSIYDNGIRFWRNGNDVGNYNLDNSPIPIQSN